MAQLLSRGEISDPDLAGLVVTVPSRRKSSPDLKLATIYVMPLGGKAQDAIVAVLDRHKKFCAARSLIGSISNSRPKSAFEVDESFVNVRQHRRAC